MPNSIRFFRVSQRILWELAHAVCSAFLGRKFEFVKCSNIGIVVVETYTKAQLRACKQHGHLRSEFWELSGLVLVLHEAQQAARMAACQSLDYLGRNKEVSYWCKWSYTCPHARLLYSWGGSSNSTEGLTHFDATSTNEFVCCKWSFYCWMHLAVSFQRCVTFMLRLISCCLPRWHRKTNGWLDILMLWWILTFVGHCGEISYWSGVISDSEFLQLDFRWQRA